MRLDDEAFESALRAFWRGSRCDAPRYWRDDRFNHPSQPVVGVSWWEADAYCAWLGAQTGWDVRLPTEAEWENAARGMEGRRYAYGDTWDPWSANVRPTHVRRTTPVGAFPTGRTPEGVDDLVGNVFEWTSSLYGDLPQVEQPTTFAYPYDAADGREDPAAGPTMRRVVRGGSWFSTASLARAVIRHCDLPEFRDFDSGFRVAVDGPSV
jgi:formylglycine-generating enzyme required for sulfatase activity